MENNDLYTRQDELDLEPPYTATVIGCGGVGSWVALDLALAGVQKLFVVDPDHIETHNLNRTPFKQSHVDVQKTSAIVELVTERRMDTEVIPVNKRVEEVAGSFREDMADSVIIDCRDHADPLPDDLQSQVLMTAGYDGFEYTLHTNPVYEDIWGDEDTEYETVPSFVAPPQLVASIITSVVFSKDLQTGEEQYTSGNMKDLIKSLLGTQKKLPEGWEADATQRNSEQQYTKFFHKPSEDLELRIYSDPDEDHTALLRNEDLDEQVYSKTFSSEEEATHNSFDIMEKVNAGDIQ